MADDFELESEYEIIDFKDDPQVILAKHLTPKALQRLDEMLDSPDLKMAEKGISKVQQMDRRLQNQTPATSVNVLNFDPSYLVGVFSGMKEMLGGKDIPKAIEERKALAPVDDDGVAE